MRILIAADIYYPNVSGASYFAQRLAQALHEARHEVLALAPSRHFHGERYERLGVPVAGISSIPIFINSVVVCPPLVINPAVARVIRDFRPDIVHVQGHFALGDAAMKAAHHQGIPILATNHFMPENLVHYARLPAVVERAVIRLMWWHFKRKVRYVARMTTPTKTAAGLLQKVGYARPVDAVSCGIDLQRFNPQLSGEKLRRQFSLPAKPILLYVGRLDKEKNLDLVISACAVALKRVDFHVVLAGKGVERQRLEEQAKRLGIAEHVTFTGFVPDEDLAALYRVGEVFMMAGTAELQSIVTMEAMASGLPVIAVRAMALPELAQEGKNAFTYEPGDAGGLADCMVRLLSDAGLRSRMAAESLRIIAQHDIHNSIRQYEAIYQSLTAAKK